MLLQHWKENLIAVSKLCCPVCWDLLALLKINGEHPVVRGRHASLSPVDLPPWLPTGTVTAMVALYRNRLLKELVAMVSSKHKRTYSDTPSLQSDGGFSLASN